MNQEATQELNNYERALVALLRRVPIGVRGKSRLARWLCGSTLDRRNVIIETRHGDRLVMPSLREPIAFYSLVDGIYEPDMMRLVQRLLPTGGTFLDVGASVGAFAIRASRLAGRRGTVVAIEASPNILCCLRQSVSLSGASNVLLVGKAVTSNGPTIIKFWPAPPDHFGMGALAAQFHDRPIEIEADTIDHVLASVGIGHVDLVKIDIEGFELAAFQGGCELLENSQPCILFEFEEWAESRAGFVPGAAQEFLLSLHYTLFAIEPGDRLLSLSTPMKKGSANILAVPGKRRLGSVS